MSVSDCMFSLSGHIVSDRKTVECLEKLIVMCVCVGGGGGTQTGQLCDRPAVTPVGVQVHVIVLVMRPMVKQTSHVWRRLYIL